MKTGWTLLTVFAAAALGCSGQEGEPATHASGGAAGSAGSAGAGAGGGGGANGCGQGMEMFNGKCVDPTTRYEPDARVDFDNVVSYGPIPTDLNLPDPPKSGFRLVVPPKTMAPGEEISGCNAWAYPAIKNRYVYAAKLYTSGGLHHSNMYGVPIAAGGPSPYPTCAAGQGDILTQAAGFAAGKMPDVLFANSTQVQAGESIVFPPGMAFQLQVDAHEVATNIHWLNPTADDIVTEVVYDFYTMPDELVENRLMPVVYDHQTFSIPPHQTGNVETICNLNGGHLVTLMPHAHKRTSEFVVDLLHADGTTENVVDEVGFDPGSDIQMYDPVIDLADVKQIRHNCTIVNDLNVPITYGIGNNEMCTLFGYMYPPSAETIGISLGGACISLHIGQGKTP